MATDKLEQSEFYEPTEADKELTDFITSHCDKWRDWRDTNFLPDYLEYERIFRGQWASEDKTRESERSRIVTPATQQAVETRHAEIMEAIFGQGDFFDIEDNIQDIGGNPIDVELIKAQLMEDFKKDKIRKAIDQIELMAEIYGTGIGEIVVMTETEYVPSTQAIPIQIEGTSFNPLMTPLAPEKYFKSQVILNANRILINSNKDEILLYSKTNTSISSKNTTYISANQNVLINGGSYVFLGLDSNNKLPTEPVLLGDKTITLINDLLTNLKTFSSALNNAVDNSSRPLISISSPAAAPRAKISMPPFVELITIESAAFSVELILTLEPVAIMSISSPAAAPEARISIPPISDFISMESTAL